MILLPHRRSFLKPRYRIDFVQQDVAAVACLDNRLIRTAITRNHDRLVLRLKAKSISFFPLSVPHGERLHRHIFLFVDHTRLDLASIDDVCLGIAVFQTFRSDFNVCS